MTSLRYIGHLLPLLLSTASSMAQETAGGALPKSDALLLTNGEKLIGHLKTSRKGVLVFKSDALGEITIKWDKVKELQTANIYAAIPPGAESRRKIGASDVREGTVAMSDGNFAIVTSPGAPAQAVAPAETVVPVPEFQKVTEETAGISHGWKGAAAAGASVIAATQTTQAYTGSLTLVRVDPAVDWLALRNRTTVNATASFGEVKERGSPTIKTAIFHGDLERDEYFSPRAYAFGQLALDHNFSQGLNLQQLYGGGLGITLLKSDKQQFDAKASVDYIRQTFFISSNDKNLLGSQFGESYVYKFPRGILFSRAFTITPAWSDTSAWSALGTTALVLPVSKKLGFNCTVQDGYLNDPPPGSKRNSLQSSLGLTLAIP